MEPFDERYSFKTSYCATRRGEKTVIVMVSIICVYLALPCLLFPSTSAPPCHPCQCSISLSFTYVFTCVFTFPSLAPLPSTPLNLPVSSTLFLHCPFAYQ